MRGNIVRGVIERGGGRRWCDKNDGDSHRTVFLVETSPPWFGRVQLKHSIVIIEPQMICDWDDVHTKGGGRQLAVGDCDGTRSPTTGRM